MRLLRASAAEIIVRIPPKASAAPGKYTGAFGRENQAKMFAMISGPTIVGDRLYLMGTRGDKEVLFALDVRTG